MEKTQQHHTQAPEATLPGRADRPEGAKLWTETQAVDLFAGVARNRPSMRCLIRAKLDEIDAAELAAAAPPAAEEEEPAYPRFTLHKAHKGFHPVARWLLNTTFRERLCAAALQTLLCTETEIERSGGYDGDAGNDLDQDWWHEIACRLAAGIEGIPDAETAAVAAYITGLETAAS